MKKKSILFVVIILILALAGVAYLKTRKNTNNPNQQNTQTSQEKSLITIENFKYSPSTLTVKAGDTINVTNKDMPDHTITADDGSFDTGLISQNGSVSFVAPSKTGTYQYHCTSHPYMKGTIIVE